MRETPVRDYGSQGQLVAGVPARLTIAGVADDGVFFMRFENPHAGPLTVFLEPDHALLLRDIISQCVALAPQLFKE